MKLSTKGRYGLRAMLDLAIHYSEGHITLKSIAARQGVSESYLEQLLSALKKVGLVSSTRGHQGGYVLNKNPEEITVAMVLDVLEGTLAPIHCVEENPPFLCKRSEICATKNVWEKVKNSIYNVINGITLKELADEQIILDENALNKTSSEITIKDEYEVIVIKSTNKDVNNIAFKGKWLFEHKKYNLESNGEEVICSIALTEKGQLFVLCEGDVLHENSRYVVFSTLDKLKESNVLPPDAIELLIVLLKKEEKIDFLDI